MMSPAEWDVCIIGGGPSGSCAGAYLAQCGWRVCVLEKSTFPRFQIGESLLPHGNDILKRIGAWEKFEQQGFLRKNGAEFTTPDRSHTVHNCFAVNSSIPGNPYTYQVERSKFDSFLLEHARSSGCEVYLETQVLTVQRQSSAWVLGCKSTAGEITHKCHWVLDASGRDTCLGRLLKLPRASLPYPKRIAIYGHFSGIPLQPADRAGNIVITHLPGGWAWNIPLSAAKSSVGLVAPLTEFKASGLSPESFFNQTLARAPYLQSLLSDSSLIGKFHTTSDYSFMHEQFAGDNHILLGDAAAFIDPVFSSGVYLAMTTALASADLIINAGRNGSLPPARQLQYTRKMMKRIRVMRDLIEAFYDDDGFAVFMHPTNRFGLFSGVGSVVAGNTDLSWNLRWRFTLFKLICSLNKRFHFISRIHQTAGTVDSPTGNTRE